MREARSRYYRGMRFLLTLFLSVFATIAHAQDDLARHAVIGFAVGPFVVNGTSSPVTTAHQSRYLVDLINRLHPGRATYVEIPGMSHDLAHYESPQAFVNRDRNVAPPFDRGLIDAMMKWLTPLIG